MKQIFLKLASTTRFWLPVVVANLTSLAANQTPFALPGKGLAHHWDLWGQDTGICGVKTLFLTFDTLRIQTRIIGRGPRRQIARDAICTTRRHQSCLNVNNIDLTPLFEARRDFLREEIVGDTAAKALRGRSYLAPWQMP
jgi:hypothetical protein